MPDLKRKRPQEDEESDDDSFEFASDDDGSDVDISSALTGKKLRREPAAKSRGGGDEDEDEGELEDIIRDSIAKRDVKGGTEMLKKTKGKTKIVKGETGGGSFQSMGACRHFLVSY